MATVVNPTGDYYMIDLPFEYGTPIEFVNESACAGCRLFSNVPQLGQGFRQVVSYKKAGADAPDAFELRVASNDDHVVCSLADGETKMLLVNQTHDTWYSQPWYFDVIDGNETPVPTVDCDVASPELAAPEMSSSDEAANEAAPEAAAPAPVPDAPASPCKTVCACDSDDEVVVLFKGYKITIFADEAGTVQTSVTKE